MATGFGNHQYSVKPFDGSGFSNWEFRIKLLLEQNEVLETLTENPPEEAVALMAFKKRDVKARTIIVSCLADNILEMIKDLSSAKEIMATLKGTYVRTGISTQVQLQRKLRSLKFSEGSSLNVFLTEFEQIIHELKSAGGKIENSEMVSQLLSAMPESFQAVTTAIDVMFCQDETKVTLEFVKSKLLLEEARQNKPNGDNGSNDVAFSGYKPKRWHYNKKQPHKSTGTNNGGSFPFKCHSCGEVGHKRYQCPRQKKRNNAYVAESEAEPPISFLTADEALPCISSNLKEAKFVIDSGATNHLISSELAEFLVNRKTVAHKISVAKLGECVEAKEEGDLQLRAEGEKFITMKKVWACENLFRNLLSVRKLEDNGFQVLFKARQVLVMRNSKVILSGKLCGNLYIVTFEVLSVPCANAAVSGLLLHRRMGHSSKYPAPGICGVCMQAKQTRLPFNPVPEDRKAKRILEVVSTDVCGPIAPQTHDGKNYFVTFIDHYSHFCICYLISKKSEVIEKFREYVNLVEAKFGSKIERVRCDNGGEYSSQTFKDICRKNGTKCQYTIPHNPEQNGVAERFNRTVMEKARCLVFDSHLSKEFWGEAVLSSVYLINRTETSAIPEKKTPAEIWYNCKPNLEKIKRFGCIAYNLIPKENRQSKLDSRSHKMIMVGYADNGYRLWDATKRKIVLGRNVIFDESSDYVKIPVEMRHETVKEEQIEKESEIEEIRKDEGGRAGEELNEESDQPQIRRTTRDRSLPKYLHEYQLDADVNMMAALSAGNFLADVPQTYQEAVSMGWQDAIIKELESLKENHTWELVSCPNGCEIIDSKWVFCEKEIDGKMEKKARLVARGFQQSSLNEDVFAPVARMVTIRMLLSLYVEYDFHVVQLDVKSAFLYGYLDKPVYMFQPEGLEEGKPNLVCKLVKSLYGLKQAPKCWNSLFHENLEELNFKRSKKDPCLYFKGSTFLLIYVDDLILFSNCIEDLDHIKSELSKKFKMKEFKNKRLKFLGLEIEKCGNELYISQKGLIKTVLQKFNMLDCKVSEVPMQNKLQLSPDMTKWDNKFPYRELIGSLMYIMLGSRPDLSYSITYFSQFQNSFSEEHWNYLKNVLRYLKLTKDFGLKFTKSKTSSICLSAFVDSDFANNIVDRKSVTGFVIKMNNNAVQWKTKKQSVVSLSSAESEYIALSMCTTESLFLHQMLSEILDVSVPPVVVYEDNQSCIKMASTLESKRTKHIDVKHYFVRDCVIENKIELQYVPTNEQQADIFTKPLAATKFKYFRKLLNVVSV